MRRLVILLAGLLVAIPATAWSGEGPVTLVTRAVEAMAPGAAPVPGGFRFMVDEVAVSVLADEGAGLLRVVARAGGLGEREVGLVASALSADMIPDPGARLVSVRGLVCAAVLAPLRDLTDGRLRSAVEGAVRLAREAAGVAEQDQAPAEAPLGEVPLVPPGQGNLPVHAAPASR